MTGFFSSLGQAIGVVPPSDRDFIKRVVGLPGDTITCEDGVLVQNGDKVEEPYVDEGTRTEGCKRTTVGPGAVRDGRQPTTPGLPRLGVIQRSDVVGRAFVRIWPLTPPAGSGATADATRR